MISQMDSLAKHDDLCNDVCIELISHRVLFDLFSLARNLALPKAEQREAIIDISGREERDLLITVANIFPATKICPLSGSRESGRLLVRNGRTGASTSRGDYNTRGIKQYEIFMGGLYERGCARAYIILLPSGRCIMSAVRRPLAARPGSAGVDCYDSLLFYIIICHCRPKHRACPADITGPAFCQI